MKLSLLFAAALVEGKKEQTPELQLKKYRGHVDFVWNQWYKDNCNVARYQRFQRLKDLIDRIEAQFGDCGFYDNSLPNGGPPADRKRRDTDDDEDEGQEGDCYFTVEGCGDDNALEGRLNMSNMGKANKQLGRIMGRFAERYLTQCTKGLTVAKLTAKGKKWTANLNRMKCIGGAGNF